MITLNRVTNITTPKLSYQKHISFGQTPPSGSDSFELTPEYIKEHPIEFIYDPKNPKVMTNMNVRCKAYENLYKLKQTNPEFYNKFILRGIQDLSNFAFYIEKDKQGKPTEYPNCILIEDASDTIGKELIKMTKDMADVNYNYVPYKGNLETQKELYEALKKGKENFEKTGKLTLLEVDDMWKMVSKDAPFSLTEWMKAVTTACATKYKTVIIYKTPSCDNIVSEVLEPHRAGIKVITKMAPSVKPAVIKPVLEETVKAVKEEIPEKKIEQTVKKVEEEIKTAVKEGEKNLKNPRIRL